MKVRSVLVVLTLLLGSASPLLRAQTFLNGQEATGILGQPTFTSGGSSNQPNRFSFPHAAVMDPTTGKVFVVDASNNRILRYSGIATAQVGAFPESVFGQANFTNNSANQGLGAPTAQTLSNPRGAHVDTLGRLWVADGGNHRVLRFDLASALGINPPAGAVYGQAVFTTAASGITANTMNVPFGVEIDAEDNLWVADRLNHRVLRFDNITGKSNGAAANRVLGQALFTTAIAAPGATGLSEPTAVEVDGGGRLWVVDKENHRVLRFDNAANLAINGSPADRVLGQPDFATVTFGTTASKFNLPFGVYADPNGNLWVSENDNRRAVRFNNAAFKANGASADIVLGQADFVSNISPITRVNLNGPVHISAGPDGSILVADFDADRVVRYDPRPLSLTAKGKTRFTTRLPRVTLRGTTANAATVQFNPGKGGFKTTGGTVANWTAAVNLLKPRNTVIVRATGPDGTVKTVVFVITRKR